MAILIKRYANRKLYNTETSRYITLKGIEKLLESGEEVRVIDNATGEDITQVALSQILVDRERKRENPSDTLLTQLLSRGGDALYGAIKKSVDDATDGLGDFQDRFRQFVSQTEELARGARGFGWEPRRESERRSPFSDSGSSGSGAGTERKRHAARAHDEDSEAATAGSDALRREIARAIEDALDDRITTGDLPNRHAIETLGRQLGRVTRAIERLETILRERTDGER